MRIDGLGEFGSAVDAFVKVHGFKVPMQMTLHNMFLYDFFTL